MTFIVDALINIMRQEFIDNCLINWIYKDKFFIKGRKMKLKIRNNIKEMIIFSISALFLAISFFCAIQCNSDDAGTYMWIYRGYEIGSTTYSLRELLDPWNLTSSILYSFGIGNTGAEMVAYCFTIWYFLCILFSLLLGLKGVKKNKWLLLLMIYILLPFSKTNKYHLIPTFIALFVMYGLYNYVEKKRKVLLIVSLIIFTYSFIVINDRVILLLFIVAPALVYGVIWCLQNIDRQKILYLGAIGIVIIATSVKVVDEVYRVTSGEGLPFLNAWNGYGGESYLTWIDIEHLFSKGIPSFFNSLLIQYNIPVKGGLIQFNSFFWLIRLFIVALMLFALLIRWKEIFHKGIVNIHILDAFSTISATVLIAVNVINGMIKYYEIEDAPMNRYASLAWFLLIIILVRWINEKYNSIILFNLGRMRITSGIILGMILALLIAGYSKPIYLGRDALVQEPCQKELDFLKEQGDKYKYGIASYWRSYPIIAMTNGEYVSYPGWIMQDENDSERIYLEPKYDGIYDDGSNYFNYILTYENNSMTIDKENIEAIRVDYIEKKGIYDGNEASVIYLYDYDVRWDSRLIMEAVGTDYELVEPIEYYFDFPVGTNRIEMAVANSDNFALEVVDNPDIQDVTINKIDDNKIQVDIVCLQNTNVTFKVARIAEELTTIHKIVLKRVKAAVTVWEDGKENVSEVYLDSGEYVFTFAGRQLDNLEVTWSGKGIETEQLTDGKIRRRFYVQIDTPQTIQYIVSGDGVEIDRISYENAVLFEK